MPWQLTLDVTTDKIKVDPLFGAGPNRFGTQFLLNKPLILNPSNYWNAEFNNGFGYLSSFVATQGIVGSILWIIFFVFFFILGIRGLSRVKDELARFSIVSSFFTSAFLWITLFVFNPSQPIIFLAFISTGLLIASLGSEGLLSAKEYNLVENIKCRRITNAISIVIVILLVLWTMVYIKKFVALTYFQNGLNTINISGNNGVATAESNFKKALLWDKSDVYYQVISGIDIMKVNAIIQQLQADSQKDPKNVNQDLVKQVNILIGEAASSTANAIKIDPTNYYNYTSSAKVAELETSLQITGAYENAKAAYTSALMYNPYSPALYLSLAQLEASSNKLDEAQKYIGTALQLKQNYTEAIFLLSQIQVNQGKLKEAITSAQVLTQINPDNSMLFFQLGFLYYNDKNYDAAATALQQAVDLNNQYANARYFLGLSLARLNKTPEAITQFEEIAKTNPDNQEVAAILANLRAGKTPFTDAKSPEDSKPEKRSTLPVKEKVTNTTSTLKTKTSTK